MSDHILLSQDTSTGIATITFNQPNDANALAPDDYKLLTHHLLTVEKNPKIHCTVLTGTGRFFSAGANIKIPRPGPPPADVILGETTILGRLSESNLIMTKAFFEHSKILIAALNGPCVGIMAGLLGFCDIIYAVPSAFILTPFSSLALVCEGGASYTFPLKMGASVANRVLLFGERLSSEEALKCGFVSKIYPQTEASVFIESVKRDLVARFSDLDPEAMLISKKLIKESTNSSLESVNHRELFAATERFMTGKPQVQFARLASKEKKHSKL